MKKKLRTVPKSDRKTKSKSKDLTVYETLTSNTVLVNVQYHGTNVEKNYIYYVNNDIEYLEDNFTKML